MDRGSNGAVAAAAPPAAAANSRRDSSTGSSSGVASAGATTRASSNAAASTTRHASSSSSSSSSAHRSSGAASGTSGADSHSISRRSSGVDSSGAAASSSSSSSTRDSRSDHHRESSSRDSRHSRDSRDRDARGSSSQRGRSSSRSDRDRDRDRDRERGHSSHSRDHGASSSSSTSTASTSTHFGASGNPVVRLRERNNILVMHRTATRRSNMAPAEFASRVYGLDVQYMKDAENPNISDKLGPPGVFPTNMNYPEEKFRAHAARGAAFVNPLPRGFGANWHLQYSFFTDKKFAVFDEVAQAISVVERIDRLEDPTVDKALLSATTSQPDPPFASYLIRNVRRIDDRICHQWMSDLAGGKKTIPELVQSFGVPFKQWRPVANVSKCPLLDCLVRYRPGFADATWFTRINVIYVEMNEIKRDSLVRRGDWFHNPRRIQRRSLGWTDQLVDYLHMLARQPDATTKKAVDVTETKSAPSTKSFAALATTITAASVGVKNSLHGDTGMNAEVAASQPQLPGAVTLPILSFHEKWSYTLRLSEYQFKVGLLDSTRYFDGLLSLLQKALSPRGRSGTRPTVLPLGVNDIMELIGLVQRLLPELLLSSESALLLVKTLLQHLRYILPPGSKIRPGALSSPLQEELVIALCQMLRDVLLNCHDVLVRLEDNGPHTWPAYVLSDRFFDRTAYGSEEIMDNVRRCRKLAAEVSGRIVRVQQLCSPAFNHASTRNDAQVIQLLDRFHRVDANVDLARVYQELFAPLPSALSATELPVDVAGVFLLCEWSITVHRPAEYRYLSTLSLLEMHSKALLEYGKENGLLECRVNDHQLVLQGVLQSFLQQYQPRAIGEVTQLIELYCLLVRRRLFSVEAFVDFAANVVEQTAGEAPRPAPAMSPNPNRAPTSAPGAPTSATIFWTAYNIECAPSRGYKSSDIPLLTTAERLRLYLWQLPRGPFPLPTSIPMIPSGLYDSEVFLLRWMDVMDLRHDGLALSQTLERAQKLCFYVFHTHGEVNDSSDPSNKDRVMKEVDYQGKVAEFVSAVKTMCGHDKGRFTLWFLRNIYEEPSFFRFSELGGVEQIVRLVCLVLEIVDILALLEVLIFFLRRSPSFVVKTVVLAFIERHEIAFCVTEQIPLLIQTFIDRFKGLEKLADDKSGSIAKFFCKLFNSHSKKIGTPDLPIALIRALAETARKNNQEGGQKKELSLETTNPIVRIPPPREPTPPEVKSALSRSFKVLQARSFSDGTTDTGKVGVSTPLASPDSQGSQPSSNEPAYEAPLYSTLVWNEVVTEGNESAEKKSRDGAIDFAATAINMSMSSFVGATNANATRERRNPNYVFVLRAVLSEVMDKWMASMAAHVKLNYRRPLMTPQYVHRCVRLIREIVDQHPDGDEFQSKFSDALLVWLQKEVIPAFAGTETQKRVKNPFLRVEVENGKEAFMLNQKGRLDRLQFGLKAFIVSLVIHKVLDLSQVLRLVLSPLFPRVRRGGARDPPPSLPSQLLAMALVYQLFSEPPQTIIVEQKQVLLDEPMTKYHLRFMRSQVPASLMFPLVHLLCQISYQMEENSTLRRREERGNIASAALFNLTADGIVREIIFHDSKEAREKHIQPVLNKKPWHMAVLMTHFFRPPHAPAEDAPNQVQVLKVDQIVDQMSVWSLNRGGSIYLDLQLFRQQQKAAPKSSSRRQATKRRGSTSKSSSQPNKRRKHAHTNGSGSSSQEIEMAVGGFMDAQSSDDEDAVELEFEDTTSATETLANMIVLRTLRKSSRPVSLQSATALCSVSRITMPHLSQPRSSTIDDGTPSELASHMAHASAAHGLHHVSEPSEVEKLAVTQVQEAQEAAIASLYAATISSISRRTMGAVIAKMLQMLEDDAKWPAGEKQTVPKINGTVVRLVSSVMCTQPGSAFLPKYMMSVATQLEMLYEACVSCDAQASAVDDSVLRRLRRKLAVRLQLVAVIGQSKHVAPTICYRNRIVKALFFLLATSAVSRGPGLSLFGWILDLIPHVRASLLLEKQSELVASLNLPQELKRRVWMLFPKPTNGAEAVPVRERKADALMRTDPWGLLEHVAPLPSDSIFATQPVVQPKRRRVFRCV